MPRCGRARRRSLTLLAAACLAALLPASWTPQLLPTASAQAEDVEPYWVVVTEPTAIRCGPDSNWYIVRRLQPGEGGQPVGLRADGVEGRGRWLRVFYPPGTPALVRASEAELRGGGGEGVGENEGVVMLTRQTRLKALNITSPTLESSYAQVRMNAVNPGTRLRYLGPAQNNAGEVEGYRVEAPEGARGFVLAEHVRPATPGETRRFENPEPLERPAPADGENDAAAAPEREAEPAPSDRLNDLLGSGDAADGSQDDASENASDEAQDDSRPDRDADADAAEPSPRDSDELTMGGERDGRSPDADTAEAGGVADGAGDDAALAADERSPLDRLLDRTQALDASFMLVAEQPTESAELRPLIAAYGELMLDAGEVSGGQSVVDHARTRLDMLRVRAALQRALAELDDIEAQAGTPIERTIPGTNRTVRFDVIGRLTVSAVYDGESLPLLYRVQAVEGSSARTLAYVAPPRDDAMAARVRSNLGSIVGIVGRDRGEGRGGPAGVRVIQPSEVVNLNPAR